MEEALARQVCGGGEGEQCVRGGSAGGCQVQNRCKYLAVAGQMPHLLWGQPDARPQESPEGEGLACSSASSDLAALSPRG